MKSCLCKSRQSWTQSFCLWSVFGWQELYYCFFGFGLVLILFVYTWIKIFFHWMWRLGRGLMVNATWNKNPSEFLQLSAEVSWGLPRWHVILLPWMAPSTCGWGWGVKGAEPGRALDMEIFCKLVVKQHQQYSPCYQLWWSYNFF